MPAAGLPVAPWSRRKFLGRVAAWAVAMRAVDALGAVAPSREILAYYAKSSAMDDGGEHGAFLAGLPVGLPELAAAVQGLMLHPFWAAAYGETLTDERREERHLRSAGDMLACLQARAPLGREARPPAGRVVGVCRHFTLLVVAALRAHGVPARARCGFADYFAKDKYEDHWVAECWSEREGRWRLVDAQLDGLQRKKLGLDFDPLDVPRDRFLVGGSAWQKYRRGDAKPEQFGLSFLNQYGAGFAGNNLVRDLAALNKAEMLPWDVWGAMTAPTGTVATEYIAIFDEVARFSLEPDSHFRVLRERYRNDPRFTVPPTVRNAVRGTTERVTVQ